MSHNLQYGNVHTNNTTDNTFPGETLFSHSLEKTLFKGVLIMYFKHGLTVLSGN